ncbi:MAG: type II-A CRISPR-associated protein Csn2 [Erysipelotrichaceae bacterium]|nr:type II-A CRISPR-associated protein Csn2 [Erysipelotrichaceae bacterium]
MKIRFPMIDEPIEIQNGTVIVFSNKYMFTRVVRELYFYSEERSLKIYEKDFREVKNSDVMIVTDILGYDVNSKNVLKLIYEDLENQLNSKPEVKTMIENLSSTITDLISYELLENELDLEYDEITILELIESLGVKIETLSDTFYEKIVEIIQVYKYLSRKKLLIFINSFAFLSENEIKSIIEYISLINKKVLFIETLALDDVNYYLIDDDFYLSRHE